MRAGDTKLKVGLRGRGLTERETEVASLVAQGWTNAKVGHALGITEKTVKFHITKIFRRLDVRRRSDLILTCYSIGKVRAGGYYKGKPVVLTLPKGSRP